MVPGAIGAEGTAKDAPVLGMAWVDGFSNYTPVLSAAGLVNESDWRLTVLSNPLPVTLTK